MSDDGLTAFCRARLGEDEAEDWNVHTGDCPSSGPLQLQCKCGYPARVLREVEAKRAILAEHKPLSDGWSAEDRAIWERLHGWPPEPVCQTCRKYPNDTMRTPLPCPTLRALTAVYSDHPGYRAEWKL